MYKSNWIRNFVKISILNGCIFNIWCVWSKVHGFVNPNTHTKSDRDLSCKNVTPTDFSILESVTPQQLSFMCSYLLLPSKQERLKPHYVSTFFSTLPSFFLSSLFASFHTSTPSRSVLGLKTLNWIHFWELMSCLY